MESFKVFLRTITEVDEDNDIPGKIDNNLGKLKNFKKIEPEEEQNKEGLNRQGTIRKVKGAHLIYKRQNEQEAYDELWQYPIGQFGIENEIDKKNEILSATDIPLDKFESEDGEQYFDLWSVGNVAFLKIYNLPN